MTLPSREAWQSAVGSTFRAAAVPGLGGPSDLTLRRIDDRRTGKGWECFSMLFEGPRPTSLLQGCFPVAHDVLGDLDLFLVPIAEGPGTRTYEAIVYRPLPVERGTS